MDQQTRNAMDIIDAIRATWGPNSCIQVGSQRQWRIVNPQPLEERFAAPTFMPATLAESNVKPQLDRLRRSVGWDMQLYEEHQQRLQAQRKKDDERREHLLWERAENMRKAAEAAQAAEELARQQSTTPPHSEEVTINTNTNTSIDAEELRRRAEQYATDALDIGENRFEVIELDAAFAAELLRHNREYDPNAARSGPVRTNRPQHSDELLDSWARDMAEGRWVLTHQGIALDTDGYILDGQNRLKALLRAEKIKPGVTIPMVVSYDWDPGRFAFLDRGRNRTLTDLYALVGETNRNHLSAVTRMCYAYENGLLQEQENWRRTIISPDLLLKYTQENRVALHEATNMGIALRPTRLMVSGSGPALYVIRKVWPLRDGEKTGKVEEFVEGLRTGVMTDEEGRRFPLDPRDPRQALRNHLVTVGAQRKRNRRQHMELLLKTWNLWTLGRQVSVIRLDSEFPTPLGRG